MTGVEWEARAAALAERLAKAGDLRAEVKVSAGAGNLALLQRFEDRLEGRFDARWAAFMAMRHGGDAEPVQAPRAAADRRRETTAPAEPWHDHREVWLLACLHLPTGLRYGYVLDPVTRQRTASSLQAPDGSWCRVSEGVVREAGPTALWAEVERAYGWWLDRGSPGWERFGLTARPGGRWWWLDGPANVLRTVHC